MAIIKCKMCGGDMELSPDKTFGTCEYCGSTMTLPKLDDEQRAAAFNRGNHFRRIGEFDKALGVYERIVAEDDTDAEAHWCCALCRFGIEYVEDPATYEWLPTCHRLSFDSFLEDVDYLAAVEHSEGITRRQYQKDAAKIAEVQRGILATSQSAEPFDVFICYKESDENGERTRDSILAQDIYYQLTEQGRRVFFARITLEDVAGTEYEPYIFAALNSARVMIVVGTKAEYLNAVWVKNEWSRFLSLMKKDRTKLLLPCYRDMDPYDMPEQLSILQSYDMAKIGFIQDLIRGVNKVLDGTKKPEPAKETVVVQQGGSNVTALIKRGNMALEDGEWDKADDFFEEALNQDAECAEAYLGKALAGSRCSSLEKYQEARFISTREAPVQTLRLEPDSERAKEAVRRYAVPGYLTEQEIRKQYLFDLSYPSCVESRQRQRQEEEAYWRQHKQLGRALRFAKGEAKTALDRALSWLLEKMDRRVQEAKQEEAQAAQALRERYAQFLAEADEKTRALYEKALADRESAYQRGQKLAESGSEEGLRQAIEAFQALGEYKGSAALAAESQKRLDDLLAEQKRQKEAQEAAERQRKEAQERAEKAAAAKRRKIGAAAAVLAVVAVAAVVVVTQVVIPNNKYNEAAAMFDAGDYEGAIAAFAALGDYKDSAEQVEAAAYSNADALLAGGDKLAAAKAFGKIRDYSDAWERCFDLWGEITVRETIVAGREHTVGLRPDGTAFAAGDNDFGQCDVSDWTDIVSVAAGDYHTVGLRLNGTVVAVGIGENGECDVSSWTDIVAVSAGDGYTVGLRSDGTVADAGVYNSNISDWTDIAAVAAGGSHTVGLHSDGTVVATGDNNCGQCDVSGWTDIVAVSAGTYHTVGLCSDGTVVATGDNNYGQCDVGDWADIVAVSVGDAHTVGLRSDGTVVAVGKNTYSQCDVENWTGIATIAAGYAFTIGVKTDGTVLCAGNVQDIQNGVSGWTDIKLP